jgi:hypothetical protein
LAQVSSPLAVGKDILGESIAPNQEFIIIIPNLIYIFTQWVPIGKYGKHAQECLIQRNIF